MSRYHISAGAALAALALSLSLSGCATANTTAQDAEETAKATPAPSHIEAKVARVYIPGTGTSWPVIGVQENGSSAITARYCREAICFIIQPDDQVTYKLGINGSMVEVIFTA